MAQNDGSQTRYSVDSVDRALDLLVHVASTPGSGVTALSTRAKQTKARAFRLLQSLVGRGFVHQDRDGNYYLGMQALALGNAARDQIDLPRLARPILEKVGRACQESVQLRIREGLESICISSWEPERDVRFHAATGKPRPLHVGSSKVLAAFAPLEIQQALLWGTLTRYTNHTLVDAKKLAEMLESIRQSDISVSLGEYNDDALSVGAPIREGDGNVVAVLNVAAPISRAEPLLDKIISAVREGAAALSTTLGYAGRGTETTDAGSATTARQRSTPKKTASKRQAEKA